MTAWYHPMMALTSILLPPSLPPCGCAVPCARVAGQLRGEVAALAEAVEVMRRDGGLTAQRLRSEVEAGARETALARTAFAKLQVQHSSGPQTLREAHAPACGLCSGSWHCVQMHTLSGDRLRRGPTFQEFCPAIPMCQQHCGCHKPLCENLARTMHHQGTTSSLPPVHPLSLLSR